MPVPSAIRSRIRYAVRHGKLVKPAACEKCETTFPDQRQALAHVPNLETPLEVIWLCQRCYNAANPRDRAEIKRKPRKEIRRIAPPWEQMKADYYEGYTFEELGQLWGLKSGKSGSFKVFKDRAIAHGEWPMKRRKTVQSNVLFDLVKDHIRRTTKSNIVWATQAQADRWAPKCVIEGRREYWGTRPAQYHQEFCPALLRLGNKIPGQGEIDVTTDPRVFFLPVEEAEDWGYQECPRCADGLPLATWGAQYGFNDTFMHWLNRGRIPNISFPKARALLEAISEPIPDSLYTPSEAAARREAKRLARRVRSNNPACDHRS